MDFAPGERWAYDNSGYVLLGAVIEEASGKTYADFVVDRIFKPPGMKATACGAEGPILPKKAAGRHARRQADALRIRMGNLDPAGRPRHRARRRDLRLLDVRNPAP